MAATGDVCQPSWTLTQGAADRDSVLPGALLESESASPLTNQKCPGCERPSGKWPELAEHKLPPPFGMKSPLQPSSLQSTGLLEAAFLQSHPSTATQGNSLIYSWTTRPAFIKGKAMPDLGLHRSFLCPSGPQASPYLNGRAKSPDSGHPEGHHKPHPVRGILPVKAARVLTIPIEYQGHTKAALVTRPKR